MGQSKKIFEDVRQKSLFQISQEYMILEMELYETGGELTPEIEKQLMINETELKEKSKNYVHIIKKVESEVNYIDDEIKRLQQAKKVCKNVIERLKEGIKDAMLLYEVEEIDLITNKINFRKSESVVIDCDINDLPKELKIIEVKPISKTEIKKMLKEGKEFKGVYIKQNKNLQIK